MCPSECSEWGLNWWSVVKTSLSNEGGSGSIPCWEAKIPHASWPKSQNAELKQHCNKSNTDFFKKKNVLSGLYDLTLLTCQIHPPPSCPGSIWPPPCPGSILSWVRGLSAGERFFVTSGAGGLRLLLINKTFLEEESLSKPPDQPQRAWASELDDSGSRSDSAILGNFSVLCFPKCMMELVASVPTSWRYVKIK